MVAIPTVNLIDLLPDFIKKNLFLILLLGDSAITAFINLVTGSDFSGIIGSVLQFVLNILIGWLTGLVISVRIDSWQILFIVIFFQYGIFKFLMEMYQANYATGMNR